MDYLILSYSRSVWDHCVQGWMAANAFLWRRENEPFYLRLNLCVQMARRRPTTDRNNMIISEILKTLQFLYVAQKALKPCLSVDTTGDKKGTGAGVYVGEKQGNECVFHQSSVGLAGLAAFLSITALQPCALNDIWFSTLLIFHYI